jgi:VCBS repeat-containing protein/YVTN family beta-propeller protein
MLFLVLGWVQRELQRTFFNQSPTAVADVVGTNEDTGAYIAVLANDIDPDINTSPSIFPGDVLTVTDYTQPTLGSVVLNPDGTFLYTPDPILQGLDDGDLLVDSFTYTVSDEASPWHIHGLSGLLFGGGHTSTTTVYVAIAGVNDPPVANPDAFDVSEDGPALTYDVVANDTDADLSDTLSVSAVTQGAYGSVSYAGQNVTYTPSPTDPAVQGLDDGETLTDTFTYTVTDGDATDTATVTVTINGANDAPDAVDDTAQTTEDASVSGNVVTNDTDIDDEPLSVTTPGTITGAYGTLSLDTDGTYTYTPGQQVTITDPAQLSQGTWNDDIFISGNKPYAAFTFTPTNTGTYVIRQLNNPDDTTLFVYDGTFDPASQNTNLIAYDDDCGCAPNYFAPEVTVDLTAGHTYTLVNSYWNNGPSLDVPLTFISTGPGVMAGTTINPAAQALDDGETLTDTFTYTVTDGDATDTATLTVTINGANDAPIAVDDAFDVPENSTGTTYDVAANDTDIDNEPLSVSAVTDGTYGTVTYTGGTVTYTPDQTNPAVQALGAGDTLTDTFTYTVTDNDATDTATVTVTITGAAVFEGPPGTINVGNSPEHTAIVGDRLYVTNRTADTVTVIDLNTNTIIDTDPNTPGTQRINVGNDPFGIAVGGNEVYVANHNDGTVTVIDTNTNTVVDTDPNTPGTQNIPVAAPFSNNTYHVLVSGNHLFVVNYQNDYVTVIDIDPNSPTRYQAIDTDPNTPGTQNIAVVGGPFAAVVSGDRLYVANFSVGTVSVIDIDPNSPTRYQVIDTNPNTPGTQNISGAGMNGARGVAVAGNNLYVANADGTVSVFDLTDYTAVDTDPNIVGTQPITVPGGGLLVDIAVSGNHLFVADYSSGEVIVIDTDNNTVIDTINTGISPWGIEIAGNRLYVANEGGTVDVIDISGYTL